MTLLVDELLDLEELRVRDGFEVREVEAHAVGGLRCAGLADVRAEDFAQRPVDQVRGAVVTRDRAARARSTLSSAACRR
jgi:hypothetical protein